MNRGTMYKLPMQSSSTVRLHGASICAYPNGTLPTERDPAGRCNDSQDDQVGYCRQGVVSGQ